MKRKPIYILTAITILILAGTGLALAQTPSWNADLNGDGKVDRADFTD